MPPNYSFTPSLYFSGKELWGLGRILWRTEFKQLNYMRTLCTWQVMCKWQICLCGMSIKSIHQSAYSFPGGSDGKESANSMGNIRDAGFIPGLGRFPWRRAWLPTPVFLPGESHGQRSLASSSPFGHKESDLTNTFTFAPRSANSLGHNGELNSIVASVTFFNLYIAWVNSPNMDMPRANNNSISHSNKRYVLTFSFKKGLVTPRQLMLERL